MVAIYRMLLHQRSHLVISIQTSTTHKTYQGSLRKAPHEEQKMASLVNSHLFPQKFINEAKDLKVLDY